MPQVKPLLKLFFPSSTKVNEDSIVRLFWLIWQICQILLKQFAQNVNLDLRHFKFNINFDIFKGFLILTESGKFVSLVWVLKINSNSSHIIRYTTLKHIWKLSRIEGISLSIGKQTTLFHWPIKQNFEK